MAKTLFRAPKGWNDIGYHNEEVLTPNMDRLAQEGVKLEQNYAMVREINLSFLSTKGIHKFKI